MKSQLEYFSDYLKVTPMALALWRSGEAATLEKIYHQWTKPVLDLGCGFGEFMGVFYDGQIEIGLDISHKDLIQAARCKKYSVCSHADARHLPFKAESFQTVISVSVLEHIPEVDKAFKEVYRVLKPGGHFILTVPTNLINQYLRGVQILNQLSLHQAAKSYINLYHQVFKHVNLWTYKRWLNLFTQSGFTLLDWQPTITIKQLHLFEYGLLPSFPSQITRTYAGKRWVVDFPLRQRLWQHYLQSVLSEKPTLPLNIAVVGVKS